VKFDGYREAPPQMGQDITLARADTAARQEATGSPSLPALPLPHGPKGAAEQSLQSCEIVPHSWAPPATHS